MNFKDIQYFIEVSNKASLTAAAECIGISQPSLSMSMKRLEEEMGTQLFNRFKTGLKLTPAGKALLKKARALMQDWEAVKHAAYEANHEVAGQVNLGCHASVAVYHLPDAFFSLIKEQQNLNLHFMHGLSREINEAIISLEIDIGIVVNPSYHPDLIIKKLYEDKVGFWHAFDDDELDINKLSLICDINLKQVQHLLKKTKSKIRIHRTLKSDNFEFLAKLAQEKAGVAILPESIASKKQLKPLMPELFFPDEICLVYRNENRFIKSVDAIVECISR